jgi:hypothetical protein
MSTSVNVPTNPQKRDHDIDNKLRLYGIISAFANGKLPSNRQIDVALSSFTGHKKLRNPNSNLSPEGRVLLEDFRNVVEEAKRLLLIKNHDEALQEFIWTTTELGTKGGPEVSSTGAPINKEKASRDGETALNGLNTLGRLMITNGQFRKLINDAVILLRDVAGDAASHAASRINPSEDELRQIDRPAGDHEWHDAPNLSKENVKQQLREKINHNKPVNRDELREVAGNATQAADPAGSRNPRETAERSAHDQRYGTNSGVDMASGVRAGIDNLAQKFDQNVPEEHKDKARHYRDQSKDYYHKKMPQDRRDQTIWRLKKMIVEIQGHPDYAEAVDSLLDLAESYKGHGKSLAIQGTGSVKQAHSDNRLKHAEKNLKRLLERFANNTSADDLIEAINDIYRDADRDPELKNWFRSIDTFIRKCLKQQGYILTDASTTEYRQLYDHGNFLLRNRYREHTDRLFDEVKFMGEQFTADPENVRFGNALQKLFNDLGTDENGKPALKKHLIKDITQVIIPDIFESIRYVPIPRIEYTDPQFDAVVENLVLEGDNIFPNVLEVGNDSYFRFGRKTVSNKKQTQVMISASQIQCDLRDISYYVRRKQGFPSITDTGIADVFLGGDGFGFKLQLSTADKTDRAHFFKVDKITVSIKHLNIKLKQSSHKTLFAVFKPILLKVMKPVIVKVLEKQIRSTFSDLDALCYKIYKEEENIKRQLKSNPDPENAKSIYQRYYQALQKEMLSRKKKAQAKTQDKHAKVALTTEDSMFKDIKLPGGISTKATDYKRLAREGNGWKTDVFTIGSAQPTTGISQPVAVSRKSPFAHRRTVKDRDATSFGGQSRDSGYQQAYNSGYNADSYGERYANPISLNKTSEEPYRYPAPITSNTSAY